MKTDKIIILAAALAALLCVFGAQAFAAEASATIYVTISDGTLVLAQEAVTVNDIDGDGAITISDALYLAHEAKFDGGAAAGYAATEGQYGLCIAKLWGVENGSGYGYYVNNKSAMGLADPVNDGDYINAFVYTDTANFSDVYCYFDVETADASAGGKLTLTLSAAGFDESWNPVEKPVSGAVITLNGSDTSFTTDENGKVTVGIDAAGKCVISAKSSSQTLVPPVCTVDVTEATPETGDGCTALVTVAGMAILVAAAVVSAQRRKTSVR